MGVDHFDNLFRIRLRVLMSENKVTQEGLSKELKITRQVISGYLTGSTLPNIEKLYQIAIFFNVSSDYLIGIKEGSNDDMGVEKFDFRDALLRLRGGQK